MDSTYCISCLCSEFFSWIWTYSMVNDGWNFSKSYSRTCCLNINSFQLDLYIYCYKNFHESTSIFFQHTIYVNILNNPLHLLLNFAYTFLLLGIYYNSWSILAFQCHHISLCIFHHFLCSGNSRSKFGRHWNAIHWERGQKISVTSHWELS